MSDDERLHTGLRLLYEQRDPGPAPTRLRQRVAAVPAARRPRWSPGTILGFARPVLAFVLTVGALLVGVLLVSIIRPSPGGPTSSFGVGAAPGPTPDLGAVAQPLALSFGDVALVVATVFAVSLGAVELLAVTPGDAVDPPGPRRGWRRILDRRPRRAILGAVALVLFVSGVALANDRSLGPGGMFQASLVHLEGMGPLNGSGAAGNGQAAYFRLPPGGTVTALQAVRNDGRLPVTILGETQALAGIELRLFARHDPSVGVDLASTPTYAFVPFELAPGEEREIVMVIHYEACAAVPVPSIEPSPDLSGDFVPSPIGTSAFESYDAIPLQYSVLGLAREADVPLFATVVVQSPSGACGRDPGWAGQSPTP